MVVRITSPHSLQRALNYNEQKCQKEKAVCIFAGNYLLEAHQMNFHQKMERLQDLIARNERAKKSNTLHISLNFDPSEKLAVGKLTQIAQAYMEKIGFGSQPYLVYQHHDAGHPHIHILTTSIQPDGRRIDTYNIGRNQSEIARKELEKNFGLVPAQGKKAVKAPSIQPINVQKVFYGNSETRRSITNVLDAVINHFKYTSLAELNAILRQYNVEADRGGETGIVYKSGGLFYRLLDGQGNKVGVPIKASLIHSKPTLKNLETRFSENEALRQPDKKRLKTSIDWVLAKAPGSLEGLITALKKEGVLAVLRENKQGQVYGITFIDYRTRAVFNGSDIGKSYSIAGIQTSLESGKQGLAKAPKPTAETTTSKDFSKSPEPPPATEAHPNQDSLFKELVEQEKNLNRVPAELLKKKRKKRNPNPK
ncbi:MAG: relaxase/mobilization nuclease domain-containing protein [Sphingobacteriales bacterium]|nr:relaxase/mobilization nuclease domain-containing protein [Sphingobacteriales bacterium]